MNGQVFKDPDILIEIRVGGDFTISLKSIPATGYIWKALLDTDFIELKEPSKFDLSSSAIGGSTEERFTFHARQAGETEILMKLQREWEDKSKEVKHFKVIIMP